MKYIYATLMFLLIVGAVILLLGGLTLGGGPSREMPIIGLACFLAILARIAQAATHQAINQEKD
jgi:hypothetical protein